MKLSYIFSKLIKKIHIPAIKNSVIHETGKVASFSHLVNTSIGEYSYIGNNCLLLDVELGKFCSIADNCIIGGSSHPIEWVSTSPVFHSGKNILKKNFSNHDFITSSKTKIGNDVWIGNNCLIKSGVIISNGAIIGMGSVVTKSVGPYEIWAGNPAKLIRKRFDDSTIDKLNNIQWWDWDKQKLKECASYFNSPQRFLDHF